MPLSAMFGVMAARLEILSQGCSANFSEGEQISGLLQQNGFIIQNHPENTDLAVLNLCTVKGNGTALEAVRDALQTIPGRPLVITGCVTPDLVRELRRIEAPISVASTNALPHVPEIVQRTLAGERIEDLSRHKIPKVGIPKKRLNPVVGILAVSNGCMDACTFCSTRLVKGRHFSFPLEKLVQEAQDLIADGCHEIWLTGQDASCWGFDLGLNLSHLVKAILKAIPHDFRLRLGMGNPRHLLLYWEDLVSVFQDPRVYRFIHLPVQSGSDSVLKDMGRKHSADDFRMLVQAFKTQVPHLTISTDIIVGFPGEQESDFHNTLDIVQTMRPLVCNITRFVVRPGTVAAKLPQAIHRDEKKRRSGLLSATFMALAFEENTQCVGKDYSILIDHAGKNGSWIGRNDSYRPIVVQGNFQLGQRINARVHRVDSYSLFATAI